MKPAPKLTARMVKAIRSNDSHIDLVSFMALLEFAEYVLIDLGLDFQKGPGGAFAAGYPEIAGEDERMVMQDCSIGDQLNIYFGFYTPPVRYQMVATENGKPCSKCGGGGCEEWAGEDCPSDQIEPLPAKSLKKRSKESEP